MSNNNNNNNNVYLLSVFLLPGHSKLQCLGVFFSCGSGSLVMLNTMCFMGDRVVWGRKCADREIMKYGLGGFVDHI